MHQNQVLRHRTRQISQRLRERIDHDRAHGARVLPDLDPEIKKGRNNTKGSGELRTDINRLQAHGRRMVKQTSRL
jgi:hypothetical protein